MTCSEKERVRRLEAWIAQVKVVACRHHPLGKRAFEELPTRTGLSSRGVEWALTQSLETHPTPDELDTLVRSVPCCERAHVLLSANVFVSAFRAIAIAIAQAPQVYVRPSRRDSLFAELLHEAAKDAFTLTSDLAPRSGDHLWAYGADETMASLKQRPWQGVVLHAHGHGYGVFVVREPDSLELSDYENLAIDLCAFDQRGCLSPRLALVQGTSSQSRLFCERLLDAMERVSEALPLGLLSEQELIARNRHRELWRYLGSCFESPAAWISLDEESGPWTPSPGGRTLHVRRSDSILDELRQHETELTCVGTDSQTVASLSRVLPLARVTHFGQMQRPPLDGPADRRSPMHTVVLTGGGL